jgi:ubiquinone/menaquinone biosynthesis C-methylase UbiE
MNPNPTAEEIRDQQKDLWNKFSPGWKKWDDFTMEFLRPIGAEIIAALPIAETGAVLDIATGTGEPGVTIAATHPKAKVTGTDLSEGMLAIAEARAKAKGLSNYRTVVADVCALPFPDGTFEAVSCRMGFMFFPDMAQAVKEMVRVLKPGGSIATSVWAGPESNPWITTMNAAISRYAAIPVPPPGAPGMFRCAAPDLIAGLFRDAGLREVTEKEVGGSRTYASPEHYWNMMNEVAAPVVSAMSKLDEPTKSKIKADVMAALARTGNPVNLAFNARVISGKKP